MHTGGQSIIFPDRKFRLHIQNPHPVKRCHIQFPDRTVTFRRIACGDDHPALRHFMIPKHLVLQKLQHGRRQRLRHTVDLIDKKNPLFMSGPLLILIDGPDDLTHGIFCYRILCTFKSPLHKLRKPHGALSCMVRDCVSHQSHTAFPGRLLHDRRFADSRRPHQKHRTLTHRRNPVKTARISGRIRLHASDDLIFCFLYIHAFASSSLSSVNVNAQPGALPFVSSSFKNTNAVS